MAYLTEAHMDWVANSVENIPETGLANSLCEGVTLVHTSLIFKPGIIAGIEIAGVTVVCVAACHCLDPLELSPPGERRHNYWILRDGKKPTHIIRVPHKREWCTLEESTIAIVHTF